MLPQDVYKPDYCMRYFPKTDIKTFDTKFFSLTGPQYRLVGISQEDNDQILSRYETSNNYIIGTLAFSVLGVLLYKRLPLLNRIEGKWKRFFMKCTFFILVTMVMLPCNIVAGFQQAQNDNLIYGVYLNYFDKFQKFQYTKDVRQLNKDVKCNLNNFSG